ncbi:MAG TPA: thiol oxidoreductase [Flavobacteriales bacterium]|nr:thiol oxidoreductase [Flavobacteriales bacterium]
MKANKYLVVLVPLMLLVVVSACNKLLPGAPDSEDVIAEPIDGLSSDQLAKHLVGDALFAKVYTPEEGLGPVFIQTACEGCHIGDGKGHPINLETRFGKWVGSTFDYMEDKGGAQMQQRSIAGFTPESVPSGYTHKTQRLAPVVTGMGLLAAVHDSTILNLTDSLDANGDGISGRVAFLSPKNYTEFDGNIHTLNPSGKYVGRYGKKAKEITIQDQIVFALKEDMGISSDFDVVDLVNPQSGNESGDNVPDPEVGASVVRSLVFYLRTLKAPTRRDLDDADVIEGEQLFAKVGCVKCHVPSLKTSLSDISLLSNVEIHPFTDLLLHDMGPLLDDGFPEGDAKSAEWRTPPLWGLGLASESQGNVAYYLHDGRATSIREVVGFHLGGEANGPATLFLALSEAEQDQIIAFLNSL